MCQSPCYHSFIQIKKNIFLLINNCQSRQKMKWYIVDHGPALSLALTVWLTFDLFTIGSDAGTNAWSWVLGPVVCLAASAASSRFWFRTSRVCLPPGQLRVTLFLLFIFATIAVFVNNTGLWLWIFIMLGVTAPIVPAIVAVVVPPRHFGVTPLQDVDAITRGGRRFAQSLALVVLLHSVTFYHNLRDGTVREHVSGAHIAMLLTSMVTAFIVSSDRVSKRLRKWAQTVSNTDSPTGISVVPETDHDPFEESETADPDATRMPRSVRRSDLSFTDNSMLQNHVLQKPEETSVHTGRQVLLFVFMFAWQICMCETTAILSEMSHVSERVIARLSLVCLGIAGMHSSTKWGTSHESLSESFKDAQFLTFCLSFADIVVQVITDTKAPSIGRLSGFAVSSVMLLYFQSIITGLVYAVMADSSNNPKRPSLLSPKSCYRMAYVVLLGLIFGYTVHRAVMMSTTVHQGIIVSVSMIAVSLFSDFLNVDHTNVSVREDEADVELDLNLSPRSNGSSGSYGSDRANK